MRPANDVRSADAKPERRMRVVGGRVACRRIGPTDVRRCAECVYLVRLGKRYIVCIDGEIAEHEDLAW